MPTGDPRSLWAPWTPEQDEVLCQMRTDFPVETFDGIAKAISVIFGIPRTRSACLARWHRIETQDTAIVGRAMVKAEMRERYAQDRLYKPETPWDAPPSLPPLPPTPSLPEMVAAHPRPTKTPRPARWYRDPKKRQEMIAKAKAAQGGYTLPPRPPEPQPKLVMRVPTLAELDLQRPSMR